MHLPENAGALDTPSKEIRVAGYQRAFDRGVNTNPRIQNGVQHNPLTN
jgi:hypothetical protein